MSALIFAFIDFYFFFFICVPPEVRGGEGKGDWIKFYLPNNN
jgi:hypothetical protein